MIAVQKLPELSHVESVEGYPVFVTMGGRVGVVFHLPTVDLESRAGIRMDDVESLIKDCPAGLLIRFKVKQWFSNQAFQGGGARGECVSQIGHVQRSFLISFEDDGSVPLLQSFSKMGWSAAGRRLINNIPIGTIEALGGVGAGAALRGIPNAKLSAFGNDIIQGSFIGLLGVGFASLLWTLIQRVAGVTIQ